MMILTRSSKKVRNVTKVSPVLKQIINKKKDESESGNTQLAGLSCDSVSWYFYHNLIFYQRFLYIDDNL